MLDTAFDGELSDHDWDHCLGGMHVLLREEQEIVGHAAVIQRRLLHGEQAIRTGYVEGVAVRADRRRRGHGSMLTAAVECIVRGAYELGALGATDEGASLYAASGWQRWEGPTSVLTPTGIRRTPGDDGCVFVLPVSVDLDLTAELTCDWRDGNVW